MADVPRYEITIRDRTFDLPMETFRVTVEGGALLIRRRRVCTMVEGDKDVLETAYAPSEWRRVEVVGVDAVRRTA